MIQKAFITISFILLFLYTYSQAPSHVPYGKPEPVELNLFNIILLIVIPVLMIIFYIYFRRKKNKEKNKK